MKTRPEQSNDAHSRWINAAPYSLISTWQNLIGLFAKANKDESGVPRLETLEDRILYDASPLSALIVDSGADADLIHHDHLVSEPFHLDVSDVFEYPIAPHDNADLFPLSDVHLDLSPTHELPASLARQLVVIDDRIEGYEELINDITLNGNANIAYDILTINQSSDGIDQVSSYLDGGLTYEAIHIVVHGRDNLLQLGGTILSSDTVLQYKGEITGWADGLEAGADILFYGCDVAASTEGRLLVEQIGQFAGADVAASDDLTGHASLGGDWVLEYHSGIVESYSAFSFEVQTSWLSTLDINSGLVLHNTFDADATDSSGNGYDGTLTNGATIDTNSGTNQIGDGKLSLDGNNDYVDFSAHSANFDNLTEGTIAVWVYHDVNSRDVIFEMSDSGDADSRLALFRDSDGSFDFYVREGTTTLVDARTAAGVIPQNTWTHVAVTVDATGNKLYVNGVQQTTGLTYATGSSSTNVFFDDVANIDFGSWGVDKYDGASFTRYFDGFLDDGRVYDRALSTADVAELYNYTDNDISSNLVMHLTLDDGTGTTADDATANNNDGNVSGVAAWTLGEVGGGLSVDYTDGEDYIEVPNSATLENVQEGDYTLAAWFDPNSTPPGSGSDNDANYGILIKAGWHVGLYYGNDNRFHFDHVLTGNSSIGVNSTDTFAPGQFYHVAGVVDRAAGTVSLYVDGQHQGTSNFTPGTAAREYGTETWKLGIANPGAGSFGWAADGTIDEARIYSRALTNGDIAELARLGSGPTQTETFQEGVSGYSSTVDTFLNEGFVTQNNATNTTLEVDMDDGIGDETTQSLIRFDDIIGSGAGQIPDNVYITSASLTVNVTNVSNAAASVSMYEMLTSWADTDNWSTTGGIALDDVEAASSAVSTLSNPDDLGSVTFYGLESSLQSWMDGAFTNFGWVINSNNTNGWDFNSSESGNKPVLSVTYVAAASQPSAVHTLTVDTANDVMDGDASSIDALLANKGADGFISLREAIWAANNTTNFDASTPDVINFAIGVGGSSQTIMVNAGGLPTITDAVVLDASTQGGNQLITLDGTNATGSTGGIVLRTNDSTVRGFTVINFPDEGIEIDGTTGFGDGNVIYDNWVGITSAGAAAGNSDDGILITEDADNNEVYNNIVGESGGHGIHIRNNSDDNWVWGNTIGLGSDGLTDRGNTGHGVYIEGNSARNIIGTDGDATNDDNEGNTISGNDTGGVYITGAGTDDNVLAGNLIGTNTSGTILVGNSGNNVNINSGASGTIVGGTGTYEGNIVAGSAGDGITIWSSGTTGTIVQGNYLGTDATGNLDWGNSGSGVVVSGGASGTLIGGTNANEGNVIAFNNFGVAIWDWNSDNNAILGNSIYTNDGLGIELQGVGVNANDGGDVDTGANDGQNTPVFTTLSHLAGSTTVNFELDTNQAGNYRIEFFVSDVADNSGKTLVHSAVVAHGGGGVQAYAEVFATAADAIITATATEDFGGGSYGSTSEFSQARTADGKYAFVVDTTSDLADGTTNSGVNALLFNRGADGRISLREAIAAANSETGTTELIQFEIKDALVGGVHTIDVAFGGLDWITDTVILDATTDSDFAGEPIIVLNGAAATTSDGFRLTTNSDGSTIRGFAIHSFGGSGIQLIDSDGNTIVGNYIGTDASGTATGLGNANRGIILDNSSSNQIGGATVADRNVIVGSGDDGVNLWGAGTTLNVIQGNYIGVDSTGNTGLGNNADGINLGGGANNNTIGGDRTVGEGNVISGQIGFNSDGIEIDNAGADDNKIYGNYIGTNYDGTAEIGNARHGVVIYDGVQGTLVGGTGTGQGNIISSNSGSGIVIDGNGVVTTSGNDIVGNYIGVDVTGILEFGNLSHGITVFGSATGNTIGGSSSAHRNIISGNAADGINTSGSNLDIEGNYIGLNVSGTGEIANGGDGIDINGGTGTTIGGTTTAQRNVISGNDGFGVYMNSATSGNYILNNYIGTNAAGTSDIANLDGIWVDGSSGNFIGQAGDGNLVSGNEFYGIVLDGAGANNNTVQANYIGTDASGTSPIANNADGVYIINGANNNLIGGPLAADGNLISGNAGDGIQISGATSNSNTIRQNYIGTDVTGALDLGNAGNGIYITGGDANVIRENLISGNDSNGIYLLTANTTNTVVAGNTIGLNAAGTTRLFNDGHGIHVSAADGTTIGGSVAADRNVINTNYPGDYAISVSNATNTDITGNYIGTDLLGTTTIESGSFAINIDNSTTTQVGGSAAGEENVIGGYGVTGVRVTGGGATIQGNYIGTDKLESVDLAAGGLYGIGLFSATGVLIGGSGINDGNVIANNAKGIYISGTGNGNTILRNRIYDNTNAGIDLSGGTEDADGVTDNDVGDGDSGPNNLLNFPVMTKAALDGTNLTVSGNIDTDGALNTQYRIEFFGNASGSEDANNGEGRYYLDSTTVTVDNNGDGSFTDFVISSVTLSTGDYVTATATKIDDPGQVGSNDLLAYGDSSEYAVNFAIVPNNSDPDVTFGEGNVTFVEDAGAVFIDATATVTDADATDFDGGVLTVNITANGTVNDRIQINHEGMSAGEVGVSTSPNEVYYGGTLIGTWSGSGSPLAITFNSSADATAVEAVAQNITFENLSDDPSTLTRTVEFQLTDGDGGTSIAITKDINVTAVNDAPTFSTTNSTATFTENAGAVTLFSGTSIDAVEVGDLIDTLVVTVNSLANGSDEILVVDGQNIELTHLNGETTATGGYDVDVTLSGSTATVTITKPGGYTAAAAEALVDGLNYNNTSEDPQGAARLVTLFSIKDDGGGSDTTNIAVASLVTITPVNDDPTGAGSLTTTSLNDNAGATNLFGGLTVSDVDTGENDLSLTITLTDPTAGTLSGGGFTETGPGTGIYTVTGMTAASADTALDNVTFTPTNNSGPSGTFNTDISVTVNDQGGGGEQDVLTATTVTITRVNDEESLDTNAVLTLNEGATAIITATELATSDVDNSPVQIIYTVDATPTNGTLSLNWVTLSATDTFTQADIDAGLIRYHHNGGETTTDSFDFTVDDSVGASTSDTFNFTVNPVNDAPVNMLSGQPQTVAGAGLDGATDVHAADLDGDGDVDLVATSWGDDRVTWFQNDGTGSFTEYTIDTGLTGARHVFVADINNDTFLDVLVSDYESDTVTWYENDGGATPTFTAHVVTNTADGAWSSYAIDMDGDGDMDVLSASIWDDKVAWYENDGAAIPGWTEHVITTSADGVRTVVAGDLDGDGDIDVASASFVDDTIAWYESDGAVTPGFTEHIVTTGVLGAMAVDIADVDADGNLDLVTASYADGKIAWFQNDGLASPTFTEQVISTSAAGARDVFTIDLDADGDLDILSASFSDDKIAWYENDGAVTPGFTEHLVSQDGDGPRAVAAADVDGDGDIDVIGASMNDSEVGYFENVDGQMGIQTTAEETPLTFNAANNNLVWIADVDAAGLEMKVRLEITNGLISLNGTTGLILDIGTGTNDLTVEFRGNITDINAALDGMVFTPTNDFNGVASIRILTDDQGNSGIGGALTDDDTINITVTPVNDAPVITGGPDTSALAETNSGLIDSGTLTVSDADLTDNVTAAVDSVVVTGTGATSVPGTLTNATLQSFLTITPLAILDGTELTDTLTWNFDSGSEAFDFLATGETLVLTYTASATDDAGSPLSDTETVTITITGTNDTPVIDLDANDSSGAAEANYVTIFTEDGGPVLVSDFVDATVFDADLEDLVSLTITLVNPLNGTEELLAADTTGTSIVANYNSATGVLSLTGVDSQANYQQVLRTVTYDNTSDSPDTTARVLTFVANDGTTDSDLVSWHPAGPNGLVGYWNFDEATGDIAYDLSGNGNHGTLNNMNAADWVTGQSGHALDFADTGGYVEIPYSTDLNFDGDFTLTLWNKAESTDVRTRRIAEYGNTQWATDGWMINQYGDDLYWYHQSGGPVSAANNVFTAGQWTHIAVTRSADTFTLYVDGVQMDQDIRTAVAAGNHSLYLATAAGGQEHDGAIDDFRVYDRALSIGEIQAVRDDHGTVAVINIVSQNDAPVISGGPDTSSLTETNSGLTASGSLIVSDVDVTDIVTAAVDSVAVTGTGLGSVPGTLTNGMLQTFLTVSPTAILDGTETTDTLTWDFNSGGEAFNFLATGETLILTYTVSATDDDGVPLSDTETVTVTITGSNDAPLITGGPGTSTLTETNSGLSDSGTLSVADADLTDLVTADVDLVVVTGTGATSVPGTLTNAILQGFLTVTPTAILDGTELTDTLTWDFNSGTEAFDFLATGETLILTYTVNVVDDDGIPLNDTETVTVTITGSNDVPVITGGPDTSGLTETDSGLTDSGTLTVADADLTDLVTAAVDSVVVTGTGATSVPGTLTNAILQSFLTVTPTAILDGTELTDSLTWNFNSGSEAFDFLADGETLILTYTVGATDDNGTPLSDTETVTVTITGTNDAPTITAVDVAGAVVEDASTPNLMDSGSVNFADLDETDVISSSVALSSTATTGPAIPAGFSTALNTALTLTQTGTNDGSIAWNFSVANSLTQYLADGETVTATYTITVTDDSGTGTDTATQDVTVVITGTNDVPTIAVVDVTGAVTEDASTPNLTDSGSVTFAEVDDTDVITSSVALSTTSTNGPAIPASLSTALSTALGITQIGTNDGSIAWNFSLLNSETQYLADGETVTATYTITVTDDSGTGTDTATQDVTVVITGTNDVPTITVVDVTGAVTEDATTPNLTDSGSVNFAEVDETDVISSSVALSGTSTTGPAIPAGLSTALSSALSLIQSGTNDGTIAWDFSVANSLTQYLADGETVTATYTITVTDDSGTGTDTATQDVTVTITGTNDDPTISVDSGPLNYTEADGPTLIDPSATLSDVDSTDFDSGTLTVDFTAGGTANDRLAIENQGTGAGQIGVSGANVSYEGTTIGTFAGGTDGSTPLVVTLNSNATQASAQALLQSVTYENVSLHPSTSPRTVQFVLTDGDGGTSNSETATISVTQRTSGTIFDQFNAVSYSGNDGTQDFSADWVEIGESTDPNSGFVSVVGNSIRITDDGISNPARGALREFDISSAASATLEFDWRRASGGTGSISVEVSGNGGSSWTTLDTFSLGGSSSFTHVQYDITPFAATNSQVRFVGNTSGGAEFFADNVQIEYTNANVPPSVSLPAGPLNFTEGDGATRIDTSATVSDADGGDFDGGSMIVDFTANSTPDDRLGINNEGTGIGQIGISGSDVTYGGTVIGTFAGGGDGDTPLVVNFNSNSTPAAAQALLRNITYNNVSEDPDTSARTVRIVVTDGDSGTSPAVFETINVAAVNDAPVITGGPDSSNLVETNSGLTDTGTLTVTDVDTSDNVTAAVDSVAVGGTGASSVPPTLTNAILQSFLTVSPTAILDNTETTDTLTWDFNSGTEAFDFLATSETLILTYTVSATDDDGTPLSDTETVTVTITGTNDAPVITGGPDSTGLVETNSGLTDTGTLTILDADLTDNVTAAVDSVAVSGTGATSVPGTLTNAIVQSFLTVSPTAILDGTETTDTLTWDFNSGTEAFDFLADGETLVLTYTVSATDDNATPLSDSETVTVTITGTNDAPALSVVDVAGAVTEDAATPNLTDGGSVTFAEVDDTDLISSSVALSTTSTTGPAIPASLSTALSTALGITQTGTNDGSIAWNFSVANSLTQYLADGETVTATYTITVTDDSGTGTDTATQDVTVVITGTNDVPTITVVDVTGAVTEDAAAPNLTDSGSVTFAEVDDTDLIGSSVALTSTATTGPAIPAGLTTALNTALTLTQTGTNDGSIAWDFSVANSLTQYLADGETVTATYTIAVTDDSGTGTDTATQDVTVVITGTNDVPTITVVDVTGAVTEDAATPNLTDSGSVTFAEVDDTDLISSSVALSSTSTTGPAIPGGLSTALSSALSLTQTGTNDGSIDWDFSVANSLTQYLADGETVTATYTITIADDSGTGTDTATQDVTVVITGTNDVPTITVVDVAGAVTEDAATPNLTDSGSVTFAEVDDTDLISSSVALSSTSTTGPAIPAGLTTALNSALSLTQTGTNDGTIAWDFSVANSLTQYLADGETVTATYTITVTDDSGTGTDTAAQDVTVMITGTNDVPTITVVDVTGAVTEDAATPNLTDSGSVTFAEVDDTDLISSSVALSSTSTTGPTIPAGLTTALNTALSLTQTGTNDGTIAWDFSVANSLAQYLADGETLTATYTITVTDDSGTGTDTATQDVTIVISGTNDVPTITVVDVTGAVTEDASTPNLTDSGSVTFAEVDDTDLISSSVALSSTSTTGPAIPAGLTTALNTALGLTQTGTNDGTINWDFSVANGLTQYLADGETVTATYTITVTDDSGTGTDTATQDVTVVITGTNDVPTIAVVDITGAVTEDASTPNLTDSGSVTFAEVDDTDVLNSSVALTSTTTTGPAIPAGLTTALSSALSLTQTGTNDGTINWDFSVANNLTQYLADGETVTATYTITVTDDSGTGTDTATQDVTVVITGTNDAPVITGGPENSSLVETNSGLTDSGTLTVSDADLTDLVTAAVDSVVVGGTGAASVPGTLTNAILRGFLTVSPTLILDGTETTAVLSWNFNSGSEAFDFLATGETLVLTYSVSATDDDGTPWNDTETVTVTITGTNDAPVITSDGGGAVASLSVDENTTVVTTVTASDVDLPLDTLTYTITGGLDSALFTINSTSGALTFVSGRNFESPSDSDTDGVYQVQVAADDGKGGTDVQMIDVVVDDVNETPTDISPNSFSIDENGDTTGGVNLGTLNASDQDLVDSFTYLVVGGADAGKFSIGGMAGNELHFDDGVLDFETQSSYDVMVRVTDSGGLSYDETLTINVNDVNEAPSLWLNNLVTNLPEDTDTSTAIRIADIVVVDDALGTNNLTLTGADAADFEIVGTELRLKAGTALDFETKTSFDVAVEVDDPGVGSVPDDKAPHTLYISDVNEPPTVTLTNVVATLTEDTDTSTAIRVADIVVSDDAIGTNSLTLSGADAASFEIVGTELRLRAGTILDFETKTSFDVTVEVDDTGVGSTPDDTADHTLGISDVNEAPSDLDPNSISIAENTDTSGGLSLGTLIATDEDAGETFTFSIVGGPDATRFVIGGSGAELIFDDGVLDFESQASYSVTIRVTDSGGNTYDETLVVNVADVNETPTDISPNTFSVDENTDTSSGFAVGTLVTTDEDGGESFTYSIVGGVDAASFSIGGAGNDELILSNGVLDFENQSSYHVTVRVADSGGNTYDEDFVVNVNDLNEAPTDIDPNVFAIDENIDTTAGTSLGTLSSMDEDSGETFTYAVVGGADAARFSIGGVGLDELVLSHGILDFETQSSYDVAIQTTDSGGLTHIKNLTIFVNDLNENPVVNDQSFAINENSPNGTSVGFAASSDVDAGDFVTYSITGGTGATAFSINPATGEITVADANQLDFETSPALSLNVQVADTGGLTDTATLTINVNDLNDEQTLVTNLPLNVNEGSLGIIDSSLLQTMDQDHGPTSLVYTITSVPANGTILISGLASSSFTQDDVDNGRVAYQHDGSETSVDSFDFTVDDGVGVASAGTFVITIDGVNDSPVGTGESFVTNEDTALGSGIDLLANDLDAEGDTLSTLIVDGPDHAASFVLNANGTFNYQPAPNYFGLDQFVYEISDGHGGTATATVDILVLPVNDQPIGNSDSFTTLDGTVLNALLSVLANDSDVESDPLTAIVVNMPAHGILLFSADGTFTYSPTPGFVGVDTFTYIPNDGMDDGVATLVSIDVTVVPTPNVDEKKIEPPATDGEPDDEPDPEETPDETDKDPTADDRPTVEQLSAPHVLKLDAIDFDGDVGSFFEILANRQQASDVLRSMLLAVDLDQLDDVKPMVRSSLAVSFDAKSFLWKELDLLSDKQKGLFSDFRFSIGAVSTVATVGYIFWSLRGGILIAAALSQMPNWRLIDPLPVLESYESKQAVRRDDEMHGFFDHL